ncbi:MAG TPA: dienelactone hydrolase family protein [Acidimicrobiales bacterium]|jgi:carboxymethylenebutenolidase|nr:dienelactone hydrolase family protein [Acidimicrobiales bacterium]
MGEMVEFPSNGSTGGGYLAPANEGAGLGVVVIQEWWGLVDHIVEVCDRFAAEGFTALAPDLYHGKKVPNAEPDEAGKAAMALELPRAAKDMSGAVDFLQGHSAVRGNGLGVVGFCMGGGLALWLATMRPDAVRAVVPFYGIAPHGAEPKWSALSAAVEGHYAEHDDLANQEAVAAFEEHLRELGKDVRVFTYPGTAHAFFNDTRPEVYNDEAARQAWVRTLEFFRAKLG